MMARQATVAATAPGENRSLRGRPPDRLSCPRGRSISLFIAGDGIPVGYANPVQLRMADAAGRIEEVAGA
jgi:hypothetical protein